MPDELAARIDANATAAFGLAVSVTPKKQLGQHFLADENILGVIGRLAELDRDDVVLEIGPGLGVLTRYLAERVAPRPRRRARPLARAAARATLAEPANVDLHWGDALTLDLAALEPPPTKLVANLPYNVATPIVVESLDGLPGARALVRDGAARGRRPLLRRARRRRRTARSRCSSSSRRGAPASIPSRAPSSGRRRTSTRRSSRSGASRCRRTSARIKAVVEAAFAHRRKTLPNSLALAGLASREQAAAALEAIGRPPRSRAEALAPAEFVALAEALA